MSRARLAALVFGGIVVCGASQARAETLALSLSAQRVEIGSDFTGTDVVLFGAIDPAAQATADGLYDIIIILRGPEGAVSVREKKPYGPFWLNTAGAKFSGVPSVISILSGKPLSEIAPAAVLQPLAASIDAQFSLHLTADFSLKNKGDFGAAIIRQRRAQGLFSEVADAVNFVSASGFRATIHVPGASPLGSYKVEAIAMAKGVPVATATDGFEVRRSGFEHVVAISARDHGLLYGLAVTAMALAFGFVASALFRRA